MRAIWNWFWKTKKTYMFIHIWVIMRILAFLILFQREGWVTADYLIVLTVINQPRYKLCMSVSWIRIDCGKAWNTKIISTQRWSRTENNNYKMMWTQAFPLTYSWITWKCPNLWRGQIVRKSWNNNVVRTAFLLLCLCVCVTCINAYL